MCSSIVARYTTVYSTKNPDSLEISSGARPLKTYTYRNNLEPKQQNRSFEYRLNLGDQKPKAMRFLATFCTIIYAYPPPTAV